MFRVADYFIVVGVDRNDSDLSASSATATIVDRYPKTDWEDSEFPSEVSMFCMPLGVDVGKYTLEERKPKIFLFSLCSSYYFIYLKFNTSRGARRYGTALMFYEEFNGKYGDDDYEQLYSPITLCIISQHPFYTFFSQYLRELYRLTIEGNTIDLSESNQHFLFNLRRVSAKPMSFIYRKEDEEDKDLLSSTGKGENDEDNNNIQIPVECYISNLINGYNNNESMEDGILIKYHIGKRVMECIKPPLNTSLSSILDDECYRSLFHILSIDNIITIYENLLLQHKIIFHSKQIENLTLISECLLNLLYPLNWTMCYVSLLPLQLIQCLESPFPYCIGVHSCFLDTDIANECIENCVIVYLDSNRITVPSCLKKDNNLYPHLPNELVNILISNLKETTPKPMITVLEEDVDNNYVIFDVIFGPGKIGIKFSTTTCTLHEEDNKKLRCIQVVGFERYDDDKTISPAEKCGSITTDSILIAINGKSVINTPIDKVIEMLKTLPRPVVLRFQIGIRPKSMISSSSSSSSSLTNNNDINSSPIDISPNNTNNTNNTPSSTSSPPHNINSSPLPPLAPSHLKHLPPPHSPHSSSAINSIASSSTSSISSLTSPNDHNKDSTQSSSSSSHHHHHHGHHRRGSSVVGNSYLFSENFKENLWVDKVRSVFLYVMIQLLGDYEKYIIKDKDDPKYPFDSDKYLLSISSSDKSKFLFMKQLKDTQSFTSFIEDHLNEVIDPDLQSFINFSREVLNNNNNTSSATPVPTTPSPRETPKDEDNTENAASTTKHRRRNSLLSVFQDSESSTSSSTSNIASNNNTIGSGTEKRTRKSSIANLFGLGSSNNNSNNNMTMEQHKQSIEMIYEKINRLNWKIKLYEVEDIKFEQLQSFISMNNIRIEIPIIGIFPRFNYQLFDSIKRKDVEFKPFTKNTLKDIEIKRNKTQTMDMLFSPDGKSSSMSGADIINITTGDNNNNTTNGRNSSGSSNIVDGKSVAVVKSRYSLNFNFNFKKSYTVLQKNIDEKKEKEEKEKKEDEGANMMYLGGNGNNNNNSNNNSDIFTKGTKFFKSMNIWKQKPNENTETTTTTPTAANDNSVISGKKDDDKETDKVIDGDEKEDIEEEEKPEKVVVKEEIERDDKPKEELQGEEEDKTSNEKSDSNNNTSKSKDKRRHKLRSEEVEKEMEKSSEKKKSKFSFNMFKKKA